MDDNKILREYGISLTCHYSAMGNLDLWLTTL
jgi:hypothetical protein